MSSLPTTDDHHGFAQTTTAQRMRQKRAKMIDEKNQAAR